MLLKNNNVALATALTVLITAGVAAAQPQVPCLFIFGDSLSDSGNNNPLVSTAKANFLPYGVDFPSGPTGRFTNGRTTIDLIGDHLGLESYIFPFASIKEADMVKGVNYASGSAGILDETGTFVGGRVPMSQQLQNHQTIISKLAGILGKDNVTAHLNKCLYSVYAGSNDYMLNYFMTKATTVTPQQFTDSVIPRYSQQIKTLYDNGARKMVVMGLSPLGCLPLSQVLGRCSDYVNNVLGQMFNPRVKSLVDGFNKDLAGAQFIFVDSMKIISPDLSSLVGITIRNVACCNAGQIWCYPGSLPCLDRKVYAFWDNAHTTEAANKVLADRAYSARDAGDAYPMDIKQLVSKP